MASVDPDASDGVITKQILKTKSGEFDVESIHTMCLKDEGISDLGCIGECTSLERLDVSYNDITRLHKLAGLTTLTKLNLSANRITSLDGLQSLENLQNLNVSGNLLGSVDVLRSICGLEKFTCLRLQDKSTGLTNPMCNTSYIDEVLIMMPTLTSLDGQRVRGRGSELHQLCQYMDKALNNLPSVKSSDEVPCDYGRQNVTSQQWVVDVQGQDKVLEAEANLKAMLDSCKALTKKASKTFTEAKVSHGSS